MKKRTKILLTVLILALIIGTFTSLWIHFSPKVSANEKTIQVSIIHLDGSQKKLTIQTEEEYLAGALEAEELISGEMGEYGIFIDTVDGEFADANLNQWWTFTVNGEMGLYGADTQPLVDGDCFEFSIYEG